MKQTVSDHVYRLENIVLKREDQPFQIAVCDDDPEDLKTTSELTRQILQKEAISFALSCYESPKQLVRALADGLSFDLFLLDVMMPDQDGMELAALLRKRQLHLPIIFISYNREMALNGYKVSASRYLAKPVEQESLKEALLHCLSLNRREKGLLIPGSNGNERIFPHEILYIETQLRKSHVVLTEGELITGLRISQLETALAGQNFIRCHQGFLVNLSYIRTLKANELELLNGQKIPVSKHRIQEVRKAFFSYLDF